jgi:hypothetical protein
MVERMTIDGVRRAREQELMGKPNVVGVGIGQKGNKDVIKVFVTHKVSESDLRPEDVIPKTIDGYELAVEEIGAVTVQGR